MKKGHVTEESILVVTCGMPRCSRRYQRQKAFKSTRLKNLEFTTVRMKRHIQGWPAWRYSKDFGWVCSFHKLNSNLPKVNISDDGEILP